MTNIYDRSITSKRKLLEDFKNNPSGLLLDIHYKILKLATEYGDLEDEIPNDFFHEFDVSVWEKVILFINEELEGIEGDIDLNDVKNNTDCIIQSISIYISFGKDT